MKSRSATTRCQTQFRLINAVSLVVWLTSASFGAAAVETSVIRQDCASYTGPYNCYQSLAAWQADLGGINFGAATPGDLVTADVIAEARIEGSWSTADTTRFELGIWNTDPDHYVWIHTTSEARHDGTAGSGYRYAPTDPAQTPLYITVSHLRLAGLEIHADSAYDGSVVYIRPPSVEGVGEIALGHNLIHGNGMNSASGILNYGCAGTLWIWNCIIWDVGDPGYTAGIQSGIGRVIASNNTISGIISGFGIRSSSGIVARNNLCNAPGDDFYGSFALGTDFNASTDNTAPGIHSHRNQNFSFVNPTLPDYHLAASDTGAANRGTDLSADLEWPFTDDVDGEVRVRAWDIGADEQASAIDSTPPVRLNGAPTGSLPPETTETVISLNTNEAAICRVDTVPGVPFASMPVVFGNTGGTSHSQTVTALYEEQTFSYYVRCQDAGANANLDDFIITFSVASSDGVSPVIENVEIVDIGPYSATIAWTTDEPATTQLEYGPSSALGRFSLRDPTLMLNHEMLLDGLDPATTYYFRAHSQDYAGNESASSTHALSSLAIVGPVYHVDQNHPLANDTNDGSEAAPWLTIQHAADVASPGDTVIVHPGSYGRVRFNHGGAPGNHITFRGSSTPDQSLVEQDAIYDPYNPVQIPGNPTLNAVCRGFHLQPPYGVVDPIIFVRIEGFEITAIYDPEGDPVQGGVLLSNTEHIQVVSNFLHDLNPSQYGYIGIRGSTHDNVDIIVRNNTIYRVQGTGISLVGKRWLVEDNEVSHSLDTNTDTGTHVGGDSDAIRFMGSQHVIRNNYLHDSLDEEQLGDPHIDAFQTFSVYPDSQFAFDILIEGNYCVNFGQMLMIEDNSQASGGVDAVHHVTLRNNIFWRTRAGAINGGHVEHFTFVNNVVADITYFAVGLQLSPYLTVENNIFYHDTGSQILDEESKIGSRWDYNIYFPDFAWPPKQPEFDQHSMFGVDPDFVAPGMGDFHPGIDSPARDMGHELPGFNYDHDGLARPQNFGWDIGAYEYPVVIFSDDFESGDVLRWSSAQH